MSSTEAHTTSRDAAAGTVDMRLEVQIIPVSDVDRAKQFYQRLGWRLDADDAPLPGRVAAAGTAFGSAADLASALRRAEAAHAGHEQRAGGHDGDWPGWYAAYLVAEQAGTDLPT